MTIHGRKVTPIRPRATAWKIRDVLSCNALWHNQRRTYADWSRLLGYHPKAIQADAIARGWKRDVRGDVIQAPCAECEMPVAVAELDDARVCEACRAEAAQIDAFGPKALYHAELRKRRERGL